MTRCEELQDLLPLHATGDITVEDGLRVEEHLDSCPACRETLALYARMVRTARLELAPEARGGTEPRPAWSPLRRRAAAAALLAASLATGLALGRLTARPEPLQLQTRPGPTLEGTRSAIPLSIFSPSAREHVSRAARSGMR
ncbi:MAG: zf-HC2 domain-containing protein [Candidatus Polarisedimenticolia bacterium]